MSSQITTIERQFGLNSKQSGLILSSNDIGFLTTVLVFSHYGPRSHIPRLLAVCICIFGISGLMSCLPQLLSSYALPSQLGASNFSASSSLEMCRQTNNSVADDICNADDNLEQTTKATWVVTIFFISMLLQGVGKSPRSSLGTLYLDDSGDKTKTGLYLAIVTTMSLFGPFSGILIGSALGKIPVDLSDTVITPSDPKWVGAWWIGFILFGILGILCAIPVGLFPRSLHMQKDNSEEENVKTKNSAFGLIKEVPLALLRVLRSPVYDLCLVALLLLVFGVMAMSTFGPKYIENQFYLPTWKANLLIGIEKIISGVIGTFFGGFVISRLKLNRAKCLRMIIILSIIATALTSLEFIFGCENEIIHGTEDTSIQGNECQCDGVPYRVMCGSDGQNYFSPCHAGCKNVTGNIYGGCSAIGGKMQATPGFCESTCPYLIPYMAVSVLSTLTGTMCILPYYMVLLRSVGDEDRALGMGLMSFTLSAFILLPAPLVYGEVFDYSCRIWNRKCGTHGSCALYDIVHIRFSLVGMEVICRVVTIILVIVAFIITLKQDKNSKGEETEGENMFNMKAF